MAENKLLKADPFKAQKFAGIGILGVSALWLLSEAFVASKADKVQVVIGASGAIIGAGMVLIKW